MTNYIRRKRRGGGFDTVEKNTRPAQPAVPRQFQPQEFIMSQLDCLEIKAILKNDSARIGSSEMPATRTGAP